jgi:hypothetical protein
MDRIAPMERLVILKNPVPALGSRTVDMILEPGRITLFLILRTFADSCFALDKPG